MNLDFHYYGTYCAARIAEYTDEEAREIAYWAQFVDACSSGNLKSAEITGESKIVTVMTNAEIFILGTGTKLTDLNDIPMSKETWIRMLGEIWCPFHFLPGNLNEENFPQSYDTEEKKMAFKLLCRSNSNLVKEMIENANEEITERGIKEPASLIQIGLLMHVLADTYSHEYFSGITSKEGNDVDSNFKEYINRCGEEKEVDAEFTWNPFVSDNVSERKYACTTQALSNDSVMYLGHGRMGHLPDYSYIKYKYRPVWSEEDIVRDNPSIFFDAFKQMVWVLKCFKDREIKDIPESIPELIKNGYDKEVESILNKRCTDNAERWRDMIEWKWGVKLEAFDVCKAIDQYKKESNKSNTGLFKFLEIAKKHKEMVLEKIGTSGIPIFNNQSL